MKIKPKTMIQAIIIVSAIAVSITLVLIDRMIHVKLYEFGLQFNQQWAFPYQIYFDLGITLTIVNAVAAGFLGLAYRFEKGKEPETINPKERRTQMASTLEVPEFAKIFEEEETETKPPSENTQPGKASALVRYCRYCSSENEPDAVFCEKCGKNITAKNKDFALTRLQYCRACGTKNKVSALYCKNCGYLLTY